MAQSPTGVSRWASGRARSALVEARAALARHQWQAAFDTFGRADAEPPLSGDDLEAYALAAYISAQPAVVMDARERARRTWRQATRIVPPGWR